MTKDAANADAHALKSLFKCHMRVWARNWHLAFYYKSEKASFISAALCGVLICSWQFAQGWPAVAIDTAVLSFKRSQRRGCNQNQDNLASLFYARHSGGEALPDWLRIC